MRILRIASLLAALAAPALLAAEEGPASSRELLWRAINFAILAGGLGYLIKKNVGPYFAARGQAIQTEIEEARALLERSEARSRAMEERFAGLGRQMEELRSAAKSEIAAEHARLERQAQEAIRKISAQAGQEIAALAKAARLELKAHAAALAVGLAEKKIAGRITPQTERALIDGFVRNLNADSRQ